MHACKYEKSPISNGLIYFILILIMLMNGINKRQVLADIELNKTLIQQTIKNQNDILLLLKQD